MYLPPFVLIIFQYCFPILTKYLNLNEHLALSPSPSNYLSSFSLRTREVNRLITDKLSLSLSQSVKPNHPSKRNPHNPHQAGRQIFDIVPRKSYILVSTAPFTCLYTL